MPYYLDAPSLTLATAVYTDAALSVCAPDGIYSDGVIARVLTSCVLGPIQTCPSCGAGCDTDFNTTSIFAATYKATLDLGNSSGDTGAVIITFDPVNTPKGFTAVYDGVVYNTFSSPFYGLLTAPTGQAVYIGDQDNDCGIVSGSPHILGNYDWDSLAADYVYNGTTAAVNVFTSQIQTTVNNPGSCVMVIPKETLNPSSLEITVYAPCATAEFNLNISCPTPLFPTYTSQVGTNAEAICQYPDNLIYYNAPVNGNGTLLGLFDYIFLDINGQVAATDGYYYAPTMVPSPYDWFLLSNGIIVQMGQCTYNGFVIERCADGYTLVADTSVPGVNVGDFVSISDPLYSACVWQVISQTAATPTATIDTITTYTSCEEVCAYYSIDNMTGSSVTASYYDCDGLPQTLPVAAYSIEYICARIGSISIPGSPAGVLVTLDSCDCGF